MITNKETERILTEDVLKHIYKCEQEGRRPTLESIAGVLQISPNEANELVSKMTQKHLLELVENVFRLTSAGQFYALQVIRAHRLWERYLADETGFAETDWHAQADRQEHRLSPSDVEALSARLGHPTHDPHGDPIPTAGGDFKPHGGQSLMTLAPGSVARIVHLEDEPPEVYAQLAAAGLYPGMTLQLKETSAQEVYFQADDKEHRLSPLVARNISVTPLPPSSVVEIQPQQRLSELPIGEAAKVVSISPACRGPERRRFMDLGILPGTVIKAEMVSPSGDPTAYLIRQALIGLRKEQANMIYITSEMTPSTNSEVTA